MIGSGISTTDKIRSFLNTTAIEKVAAKIPVLNEFAAAADLTRLVVHVGLDICDGKDWLNIKHDMHQRAAAIVVEAIPTGSLPLDITGLRKPVTEIVKRALMAQTELYSLNPRGAFEAITKGHVSEAAQSFSDRRVREGMRSMRSNRAAAPAARQLQPTFA